VNLDPSGAQVPARKASEKVCSLVFRLSPPPQSRTAQDTKLLSQTRTSLLSVTTKRRGAPRPPPALGKPDTSMTSPGRPREPGVQGG